MYSGSLRISRPPSAVTWFPNLVAKKICTETEGGIVSSAHVFEAHYDLGLGDQMPRASSRFPVRWNHFPRSSSLSP